MVLHIAALAIFSRVGGLEPTGTTLEMIFIEASYMIQMRASQMNRIFLCKAVHDFVFIILLPLIQ